MQVFWTKTYEGASLTDLTGAMGINAPSLYAAFGNKEALFREAVAHYSNLHGGEIWGALDDTPTIREAIERFLLNTAAAYSTPGTPPGCLIVLGTQHGVEAADAAHCNLRERRRDNMIRIEARLKRAVADGELSSEFDVEGAAAFILSIQTGMSVLARDGADRKTLEAVARKALRGWNALEAE